MQFERHLEGNIFELRYKLANSTYRHSKYTPFTIFDPKKRRIHKACVKDRLVHQAIVQAIEPLFEKKFIFDSYSCRRDKGTHRAVKRLRGFIDRLGKNHTETVYVLKCDIRKFFASVNHKILTRLMKKRMQDKKLFSLITQIIDSFHNEQGRGIPLGNITSQLFANIYLHELDHFMKFRLGEKNYIRYCDDFVIVHNDKKYLTQLIYVIDTFVKQRLDIQLHPNKISIRTPAQGIDFLGYRMLAHATVLRTETRRCVMRKIDEVNDTSYLGFCQHVDSFQLQEELKNLVWYRIE